jgi:hypothetical protein
MCGHKAKIGVVVEIKGKEIKYEYLQEMVTEIEGAGMLKQVTISSVNHQVLIDIKAISPGIRTMGLLVNTPCYNPPEASLSMDFMEVEHLGFAPETARKRHDRDTGVSVSIPLSDHLEWPFEKWASQNWVGKFQSFLEEGCFGAIMTDDAERAVKLCGACSLEVAKFS